MNLFINKNVIVNWKTFGIFFLLSAFASRTNGQVCSNIPEKVYRYCYVAKPNDWYKAQAKLWGEEVKKSTANTEAWYNLYFSKRYASMGNEESGRRKMLDSLVEQIGKSIPGSYLYPYLKYYNGERDIKFLETAYKINPASTDLYWEFIQYFDTEGNAAKKKEFCKKLYSANEIIPGLFDYSYNILNSLAKNAIVLTNGDNDTYPLWVLQEAKNVRKDVTVMNAHALFVLRDYLKMKLQQRKIIIDFEKLPDQDSDISEFLKALVVRINEKYPNVPIYFVPTMDYESIKGLVNNLYNTAIAFLYSKAPIETTPIVKRNLEKNLKLEYLENDKEDQKHISYQILNELNLNYIPAFMELSKFYKEQKKVEQSNFWKERAMLIARKGGDTDTLKKIEEEKY